MSDSTRYTAVLAQLESRFGGRPSLTPGEALSALPGASQADPDNAATQRIGRGSFPFPFRRIAGRNVVLLVDVASVLAGEVLPSVAEAPTKFGRRPGRPRKAAGGAP